MSLIYQHNFKEGRFEWSRTTGIKITGTLLPIELPIVSWSRLSGGVSRVTHVFVGNRCNQFKTCGLWFCFVTLKSGLFQSWLYVCVLKIAFYPHTFQAKRSNVKRVICPWFVDLFSSFLPPFCLYFLACPRVFFLRGPGDSFRILASNFPPQVAFQLFLFERVEHKDVACTRRNV